MNSLIRNSFDSYFNNILKDALQYSETFTISINENRILLRASRPSELIRTLWTSGSTLNKIKDTLLLAFQRNNPDISNVNINLISNREIEITYNFSVASITELGLSANVLKNLSSEELLKWCNINKQFADQCNLSMFWVQLFNARFGELPKWLPENINYRKFYIDILKYVESTPTTEKLIKSIKLYRQYDKRNEDDDFKDFELNLESFLDQFLEEYRYVLDFFNNLNEYSIRYLIENKIMTMQDIITMMVTTDLDSYSKHANNVRIIESLINNYDLYFEKSKYFYPSGRRGKIFLRPKKSSLLLETLFKYLLEHYLRFGSGNIKLINKLLSHNIVGPVYEINISTILSTISRVIGEIGIVNISDELITVLENYINQRHIPTIYRRVYNGSLKDYINVRVEKFNKNIRDNRS